MKTIQRDIVGGFIFSKDGRLLLGKNRTGGVYEGSFVVPGGGVDEGETKTEALRREMLEETGLDINHGSIEEINTLIGEHEKTLRDTGERVLVKMNFYNYRIDLQQNAVDTAVRADDDWSEPQWFDLNKLSTINLSSPTKQTLIEMGILK